MVEFPELPSKTTDLVENPPIRSIGEVLGKAWDRLKATRGEPVGAEEATQPQPPPPTPDSASTHPTTDEQIIVTSSGWHSGTSISVNPSNVQKVHTTSAEELLQKGVTATMTREEWNGVLNYFKTPTDQNLSPLNERQQDACNQIQAQLQTEAALGGVPLQNRLNALETVLRDPRWDPPTNSESDTTTYIAVHLSKDPEEADFIVPMRVDDNLNLTRQEIENYGGQTLANSYDNRLDLQKQHDYTPDPNIKAARIVAVNLSDSATKEEDSITTTVYSGVIKVNATGITPDASSVTARYSTTTEGLMLNQESTTSAGIIDYAMNNQ